jgi:hypothetical protein
MRAVRLRLLWLAVTAAAFCAWIGWLAFLVLHQPVILPHAPFLVAGLNVVATVDGVDDPVTIQEVVWARDPQAAAGLKGRKVRVTNLPDCRPDWHGPGAYLLPLLKTGEDSYQVADATGLPAEARREHLEKGRPVPSLSPGYDPVPDRQRKALRPPHIYPLTPETLAQLRQIHAPP